jgi:hypothetical protein
VFPVRYELDLYILFIGNSVLRGLREKWGMKAPVQEKGSDDAD